jgi:hypothetical protein
MEGMLGISVGVVLDWFKSFLFVEKAALFQKLMDIVLIELLGFLGLIDQKEGKLSSSSVMVKILLKDEFALDITKGSPRRTIHYTEELFRSNAINRFALSC